MTFVHIFSILFALANPIANALIFDSLNKQKSASWQLAFKTAVYFTVLCCTCSLFGQSILNVFSINISTFRSCGGILIFLIGLSMIQNEAHPSHDHKNDKINDNWVLVPLCMPILCGPGTISSLVFLSSHFDDWSGWFLLLSAIALDAVLIFLCFGFSSYISKYLGKNGSMITTRLFGIILLSMGGQMFVDGIKAFFGL